MQSISVTAVTLIRITSKFFLIVLCDVVIHRNFPFGDNSYLINNFVCRVSNLFRLNFAEPRKNSFPLGRTTFIEPNDSISHESSLTYSTSLRNAICLPADVQTLGQLAYQKPRAGTDSGDTLQIPSSITEVAIATPGADDDGHSDPVLAVSRQLSFVRIAAAAQQTLDKCTTTDLFSSPYKNVPSSSDKDDLLNVSDDTLMVLPKSSFRKLAEKPCPAVANPGDR